MALLSGGRAHFQAGDYVQARDWLDRGLATPGATYPIWKVSGLGSLALLEAWCGNTERASCLVRRGLGRGPGGRPPGPSLDRLTPIWPRPWSPWRRASLGVPRSPSTKDRCGPRPTDAANCRGLPTSRQALLQEAEGQREQAMATALSTRNDLGAPPPPIVAGRLLALHCRLLRLGGSPEQAQRALDRATWYSSHRRGVRRSGDSPHPGRARSGPQAPRRPSHPAGCHRALGDGGRAFSCESWLADTEGSVDGARTHLAAAMAVAEHTLPGRGVRAGRTDDRPTGVRAHRHGLLRSRTRSSGGPGRRPCRRRGPTWSTR